jgi:hypothetical protein
MMTSMLDIAGGILIASITVAVFMFGARLAVVGNGRMHREAVISSVTLMAVSGAFALRVVFLR